MIKGKIQLRIALRHQIKIRLKLVKRIKQRIQKEETTNKICSLE